MCGPALRGKDHRVEQGERDANAKSSDVGSVETLIGIPHLLPRAAKAIIHGSRSQALIGSPDRRR